MEVVKKLSKELPFAKDIQNLKKELDKHRPLSEEIENRVLQKLRLDWNYNSNAIEGNTFTFGETIALLMEGITAKGKPLKDALDIKGHNDAIDFMMGMIYDKRKLNETDIRSLHKLILGSDYYKDAITSDNKPTKKLISAGKYKTEPNHVKTATGEIYYYASPTETPAKMSTLVNWYNTIVKGSEFNPVVLASIFHHRFVAIHPFDDGNGRLARILTNFILLKFGYPISVIKQENKGIYYASLSQADNGKLIPIIEYISETVRSSLKIYFKALSGEDINEPDDLDKEIALFRKEIGIKTAIKKTKKDVSITKICFELFSSVKNKLDKFSDLFSAYSESIINTNPSKTYSFNNIVLSNFDTFLNLVKDELKNSDQIYYDYLLNNDIYLNNLKINIRLAIDFKVKNYIVIYRDKRLVKYYDEPTLDIEFYKMLEVIVKDVMAQIKTIKK